MYKFDDILFINIDAKRNAWQLFDLIRSKSDVASFPMLRPAPIKKFIAQTVFLQNP
jgi:hypothetical protein